MRARRLSRRFVGFQTPFIWFAVCLRAGWLTSPFITIIHSNVQFSVVRGDYYYSPMWLVTSHGKLDSSLCEWLSITCFSHVLIHLRNWVSHLECAEIHTHVEAPPTPRAPEWLIHLQPGFSGGREQRSWVETRNQCCCLSHRANTAINFCIDANAVGIGAVL